MEKEYLSIKEQIELLKKKRNDFKTKPKILNEWKNKLYINESLKLTGRIANTILIMEHLIVAINDKFPENAIKKCLLRLYNKDINIVK